MWKALGISLGITLLLGGCTTTVQPTEPIINVQTYDAPKKTVWTALIMSLADKNFVILVSDADGGLVTTGYLIVKETTSAFGLDHTPVYTLGLKMYGADATLRERLRLTAIVSGDQIQSKVRLKVRAQAADDLPQNNPPWMAAHSSGKLESDLFGAIQEVIGKKGRAPRDNPSHSPQPLPKK